MEITISLNRAELTKADIMLIQECLGLTTETQLKGAIKKLSRTAFMEYVKMFKEKGLPTRAAEVQQERLFFLLTYFYENRIPSENEISSIFQLTPSQSTTLLRNTISKNRTKINNSIKNTLLSILNSAKREESGSYEFVCTSPTAVEEMNLIIREKGPTLHPVEKIRGIACKYSCAPDTYSLLKTEL